MSSNPGNWDFSSLKNKLKNKLKNAQQVENDYYTEFDFTVDEGKERLNPSREKNEGMHRRRKVDEKSCVAFLLCDPGWYIQQN